MRYLLTICMLMCLFLIALPFMSALKGSWLLDLAVNFQFTYALLTLFLIMIIFWLARPLFWISLCIYVVFTAVNFASLLPAVPNLSGHSVSDDVFVFQGNLSYYNADMDALYDFLDKKNADIYILFEVNDTQREAFGKLANGRPNLGYAQIEGLPAGMGIISKYPIVKRHIHQFEGKSAVIIELELLIDHQLVRFYALHPPSPRTKESWQTRNQLFAELKNLVKHHPQQITWITGDINTSPWSYYFPRFDFLTPCIEQVGYYTSWPHSKAVAWLANVVRIAIDHCFMSEHMTILEFKTVTIPNSDHLGLEYRFILNQSR